jgi:hypothetical protein
MDEFTWARASAEFAIKNVRSGVLVKLLIIGRSLTLRRLASVRLAMK